MADLLDILTGAEGQRAALGSDSTGHETEIARMVTAVSNRIDELVGPVVVRTITEYHDGGVVNIRPRKTPISSITTLKEWDGSTVTTLTADTWGTTGNTDGYWLDQSTTYPHACKIERRSSGSRTLFAAGPDAIELVYVAGRAADTESVAARYKECAAEIIRRLWKREGPIWSQASSVLATISGEEGTPGGSPFFRAVDPVIKELLGDEKLLPGIA